MTKRTFTSLFNQYETNLVGFGIKLTRSESDAKDLIQESSIKAYLNMESFKNKEKFKSWFLKIMYNTFVSKYRKNKRRREIAEKIGNTRLFLVANENIMNDGYNALEVEDVNNCIDCLSFKTKETLLLYTAGYQYSEIAEKLTIPIGTVKSRISAARNKIKGTMVKFNTPMSIAS